MQPHASQLEQSITWDPGPQPNSYLMDLIISSTTIGEVVGLGDEQVIHQRQSRTELDSHANMAVVGSCAYIIGDTGRTVEVNPFTPQYESLKDVKVVDAALLYVCNYTCREVLLIIRNALYIPSMHNNLIPPFIIREAGVTINDTPKIHMKEPGVDDHAIIFNTDNFRIHLKLHGIFSYLPTSKPTKSQILDCEDVYLLSPEHKWNPHDEAYAHNEDSILDHEGNIKEHRD